MNNRIKNKSREFFYKYFSLIILVIQTTICVLLLRYSKKFSNGTGNYLSSTAVFFSELLKLFTCLFIIYYQQDSFKTFCVVISKEVFKKPKETFKLIIPAFLYTIQNNLLFLALTNLDAATYQVTYQIKIITTACFSVLMLQKKLSLNQWAALFFLFIGVILVQWSGEETKFNKESKIQLMIPKSKKIIGLFAVILSSFSSGFSGVYFEKLIKFSQQSLWIRNFQMAIFGCIFSKMLIIIQDYNAISENGFFQGYNTITFFVILIQAFGGIVVSYVMKHADNILKGFATSISIILSGILSYFLLNDYKPSYLNFIGSLIVILSTILYTF